MFRIRINPSVRFGKRKFLVLIGLSGMFGCTIVLFITFIFAFLNGAKLLICINNYSEMYFELFLLVFILVLSFYVVYFYCNYILKTIKRKTL
jgi:hypothetical protein